MCIRDSLPPPHPRVGTLRFGMGRLARRGHNPPWPVRPPAASLSALDTQFVSRGLCCWGDSSALPIFWARVSRDCNGHTRAIVTKILRVVQRDGLVRFDFFIFRVGEHLRSRLQRFAPRWGWYLRHHHPYWVGRTTRDIPWRPHAHPAQPTSRIASLHVNGLRSAATKVTSVAALLHEKDLDVLLL